LLLSDPDRNELSLHGCFARLIGFSAMGQDADLIWRNGAGPAGGHYRLDKRPMTPLKIELL
jgi:hypothetical protein